MKNRQNIIYMMLTTRRDLKKAGILCFLLFLILNTKSTFILQAQENNFIFKHLTIDDGLSQSQVNCIFQDSRDFMWFGTSEGLNRYDGYEFLIFQRDDYKAGNLSGNFIKCIYEDSKNNLWIGTWGNGINLYNRDRNNFKFFSQDSSSEIKISSNFVNSILEDSQGNLWIGTSKGIDLLDIENNRVVNFIPSHLKDAHLNRNENGVLFEDSHKNLWFGTVENGLGLFDYERKTFKYFCHNSDNKHSISDNNIQSIYEDSAGNLWIGTYNGGLNLFDRENNVFYQFLPEPKIKESLTVKAILDDDKGNLFICTRNGLYLFNKKRHQFLHCVHDSHNPFSLSHNNVQTICKDAAGDFWFGTKQGINYLNTRNIPFILYRADVDNNRCLNSKVIHAILEDSRGELWFGTEEGGLNRYNRKTGIFSYYTHNPNDPNTISSNDVTAIAEDENGNLWIGAYQGGLNLFDKKENRFTHYKLDQELPFIYQSQINSLLVDTGGDIWIGSSRLFRFNKKKQTLIPVLLGDLDIDVDILTINQDSMGKIWLGDNNNKIYCIDKTTLESAHYRLSDNNGTLRINTIQEDRRKNIWIGTQGDGLYFFDRNQKTFRRYTYRDGLASNNVLGILEDDQGDLWLSTSKGLSHFNPKTKVFNNYYKESGLQGNRFTKACYKTRSGEMFFGGIHGATAFYPHKILKNPYIPPVVVTDFKIFNKSVEIGGEHPILEKHVSESQMIKLSYKHSVFSFTFAALNYSISEQNQYAYMMEGFETDWNYVGSKKRFATYTNLNPGTYTFKVKASNNDGLWNENGTSLAIIISSLFWQTWWFKSIVAAILLLIIWLFINYFEQKRNLLKATALANVSQLKLLRNQMDPHFLFNALGSIRSLILMNKDQAWQMVSELSDFFKYTLLNFNNLEVTLNEEIEAAQNYLNIEKIQFEEPLKVSFKMDDAAGDCIVPAFIFQPMIENAMKHGLKKVAPDQFEIVILILYRQEILSIDVSNTGELINHTGINPKDANIHGTSLENMKKRLNLMFKDQYTFQLYEENGWVHAKIRINYKKTAKKIQP